MKILEKVTPRVYGFFKRNPVLIKPAKVSLALAENARACLHNRIHGDDRVVGPHSLCEDTGDWVRQFTSVESAFSTSIEYIHDPEIYSRKIPGHIEKELYWKFAQNLKFDLPSTFVAQIPAARVLDEGFVISPDNQILGDVSAIITPKSSHHLAFTTGAVGPVQKFRGKVAVLATYAGRGYYHWMLDVLPRIELLTRASYDLDEIDKFIVNSYVTSYQIETLERLGIPREKLIQTQWTRHLWVELLILPSLSNVYGSVPKWSCDFINWSFLDTRDFEEAKSRKLYISRGSASHRHISNERALIDLLKSRGFEVVVLEKMTVADQARLFRSASIVVGPHGAGLTNLVFCEPHTKVVEIISPSAVNVLFWTIASQSNLDYNYFFANGELPKTPSEERGLNSEDLEVDLQKMKLMLDAIGCPAV